MRRFVAFIWGLFKSPFIFSRPFAGPSRSFRKLSRVGFYHCRRKWFFVGARGFQGFMQLPWHVLCPLITDTLIAEEQEASQPSNQDIFMLVCFWLGATLHEQETAQSGQFAQTSNLLFPGPGKSKMVQTSNLLFLQPGKKQNGSDFQFAFSRAGKKQNVSAFQLGPGNKQRL